MLAAASRGSRRRPATVGLVLVVTAAATMLSACGAPTSSPPAALGRFPVATPVPDPTPVSAVPGHPQLVAMGDDVAVTLTGASLLIDASGPEVTVLPPAPGARLPDQADGVLSVRAVVRSGVAALGASQFVVHDEQGRVVALRADPPTPISGASGATLSLRLSGTFPDGSAELTWAPRGAPLVTWDFTIEID